MLTSEQRAAYVKAEMQDYFDGCYADHGSAKDQLNRFAQTIESAATAPLLAEIERLTRELEEAPSRTLLDAATKEIDNLTRELEEARKDAERYRWLCGFSSVSMPELTWGRRAGIPKNKLDAAIDAAIKEQP